MKDAERSVISTPFMPNMQKKADCGVIRGRKSMGRVPSD